MGVKLASRYQPALVALHWLTALMIVGLLCVGFLILANMPNTDPTKLGILKLHMAGGMVVLLLMVARLLIRAFSARLAAATTGSALLDRFATLAHSGLIAIVLLMVVTGWSTGYLIRGAFEPSGALPESFAKLPTFLAHATLAVLLTLLIAVHAVAALYHQFVLKDRLFQRMWFGHREIERS